MENGKEKQWNWLAGARTSHLRFYCWTFFRLIVYAESTGRHQPSETKALVEYACFNTIFQVVCSSNEILLFESARYGRNDSTGALRCDLPFTRSCDVDVQYSMSRACGGKRKCSIAVNTAFFGDPCGYEEFLKVVYRCIPSAHILRRCPESTDSQFFERGYLASPNYPGKYYLDVECKWHLAVQQQQSLRITLYDFELDVKRAGSCHDFLDISTDNMTYFRECGTLGKQVLDVSSSSVVVWFRTGQTSLTQRGFILYLEAIGRGCQLSAVSHSLTVATSHTFYFLEDAILFANVTCAADHEFSDGEPASRLVPCHNDSWTAQLPPCLRMLKEAMTTTNDLLFYNSTQPAIFPASFYSVLLGVVASVLLLILLFILLAICCNRRRRSAKRKRDDWRIVVNNLQDNVINDVTKTEQLRDEFGNIRFPAKTSHACAKRHNTKRSTTADDWPNRNLLFTSRYVIDEADDRTLRHGMSRTEREGSFMHCPICQFGSYVGFLSPYPSSCDEQMELVIPEVMNRRRAQSEPQSAPRVKTLRPLTTFYSSPDLDFNRKGVML